MAKFGSDERNMVDLVKVRDLLKTEQAAKMKKSPDVKRLGKALADANDDGDEEVKEKKVVAPAAPPK